MHRFLLVVVVISVVMTSVALAAPWPGLSTPSDGIPYLKMSVEVATGNTFADSDMQTGFSAWIRTNLPSEPWAPSVSAADIVVASQQNGNRREVHVSLASTYTFVQGYTVWPTIISPFQFGAVVDSNKYTPVPTSEVVKNEALAVEYSIAAAAPGYANSWAHDMTVTLDSYPRVDDGSGNPGYVEFMIHPKNFTNSSNIELNNIPVRITYPSNSGTFSARGPIGTYTLDITYHSGSAGDPASRYVKAATLPTWSVGSKLDAVITEPTTSTYVGAPSDSFTIEVPSHRSSSIDFRVSVSVNATPSNTATMTVSPTVVTITTPGVQTPFTVTGSEAGAYILHYRILNSGSATDFNSISRISNFIISPRLNISIGAVSRGYLINDPVGAWGGAWSDPFPIHIEKLPRNQLTLTPVANDVEFSPVSYTFTSTGGRTFALFSARALTRGYKSISVARSGSDADFYSDPVAKDWTVQGPNTICHLQTNENDCWNTPACQWNSLRSLCSNRTLSLSLSALPELFDLEESRNITLTLASPTRNGVSVTFESTGGRLTFNPATVYFSPGDQSLNFTITGTLGANDGRVSQAFTMRLSGTDLNVYTESESSIDIRPRIQCSVTPPPAFFVGTESTQFLLSCDTAPEVDVTFTPIVLDGISWVPIVNGVAGNAGDGYQMLPGTSTSYWIAVSTTSQVGSFLFTLQVSGTNAARYAPIVTAAITVLPSGELITPPSFFLTAFDISPSFHVDVTVQPPSILEVAVEVRNKRTGQITADAQVFPTLLKFNNTKRNFIRALSNFPGNYTLTFIISGVNERNYLTPQPLDFEVKPRLDGKAFEARTTSGYTPELRCRIQVGRQSLAFKGQAAIDSEDYFCDAYTSRPENTTYNCSVHLTEERCRNEMETNGNVCVWHQDACQFLDEMQGKVKQVAFGSGFTIMLTHDGRVFSIGSIKYGQLGHYSNDLQEVPMPEFISAISSGTSHTIALSNEGRLYSWGANYKGQLGQNSRVQQTEQVGRVRMVKGENVTCISSGTLHSGAVTLTGRVYMWGSNEFGQLGMQDAYRSHTLLPNAIRQDFFDGEPALALQCGEYHTMVGTSVEAFTFGSNTMGQLGRDGFDEWMPGPPVLWFKNQHNKQPNHLSWKLGRDCPSP